MLFSYHLRYYYKFIIGGQWRHSTASPTERDERGNLNNIIVVGDIASVRPTSRQEKKVNLSYTDLKNSNKIVWTSNGFVSKPLIISLIHAYVALCY